MKKFLFSIPLLFSICVFAGYKNIGYTIIGDPIYSSVNASPLTAGITIDANGERAAVVIRIPPCTIRRIGYLTGTVTTAESLLATVETVSNGNPSGTYLCTNSSAAAVINGGNLWKETQNLTADCTVLVSTVIAVVFTSTGATFNGQIARHSTFVNGFSYTLSSNSASGYVRSTAQPIIALYDASGSTIPILNNYPVSAITNVNFSSTTNPNTRGNTFIPQYNFKCPGFITAMGFTSLSADYRANLWSGNIVIATVTVTALNQSQTTIGTQSYTWDEGISPILKQGQTYRITEMALSSTTISLKFLSFNHVSIMKAYLPLGDSMYTTTANNPQTGGAFTDTLTARSLIWPIASEIDTGIPGGAYGVSQ